MATSVLWRLFQDGDELASALATVGGGRKKRYHLTPGNVAPHWGPGDGRAVARFVVDARGRVETATIEVDQVSRPALANALVSVLPGWRFDPARHGRRAVRQVVEETVIKRGHYVEIRLSTDGR